MGRIPLDSWIRVVMNRVQSRPYSMQWVARHTNLPDMYYRGVSIKQMIDILDAEFGA